MNRALSAYLDAIRFLAALAVLVSHWAYERFTGGEYEWMRRADMGGDAVIVFFVMSGLVVAFAADRRAADGLKGFAADRLSRLWSVAIPALAVTFLLDPVGLMANPSVYEHFYAGDSAGMRILSALSFSNELWFTSVRPGSNGPWWSLGYEAWFYAAFGCFVFLRGRARLYATVAALLLAGPKIWLMMPPWLMGVALWHCIRLGVFARIGRGAATAFAVLPVLAFAAAHAWQIPALLKGLTFISLGPNAFEALGYSDTFLWGSVLGLLLSVHLVGIIALSRHVEPRPQAPVLRAVHWLAGGSFALYLVHYPVMQLVGAVLPGSVTDIWRQALVLLVPLLVSYAFAEVTERRRSGLRIVLRNILNTSPPRSQTA